MALVLQAHDKEYIAWASEDIRVDGKLMEHVSFQSFVRKFGFTSKEAAMSQYEQLLNSSRLSKTRRERLRATYDDFVKTHLDSFWLEWDRELANYEFDASCETVVKRTATLAQQASLAMSARGFSAVQTNSTGHNARADAAVHKGNDSGSSSNDENNDNAVADEETATASSRSDSQARGEQEPLGQQSDVCQENNGASTLDDDVREDLIDEELSNLLAHIAQVQHSVCEWRSKDDDACIACLFQQYQRECVQALHNDRLHNADIADAMAIIGVFAPFLQTQRMRAVFSRKILSQLVASSALPDPDVDDAAVLKAIRLRINNRREDASQALGCMDRKLRIMFDNLLEFLPEVVDRSISEVTFTVNYVAPVLNCILKIDGKTDVQYPNTDCHVQKHQGSKPDRPDILVKAHGHEILYGEITGPCRANCRSKTNWDLFRLARFGKAFLDRGNHVAPLLQVVHDTGTVMRLSMKIRGIYILERIGLFSVPCSIATVPALLATLPPLLAAKEDVDMLAEHEFDANRKRSWRFDDILDARKRIK
ncbi:hypothetical protein BC939DRAFT_471359 [Gamsiella multidivaricata]|uniref:uncharacterized protein n=1 Tax=Gamsiella multidivaricata TaxID=101098 RepID=UPI00221F5195|nr:uncharacterized protein BC939DRAFT_471359 [Gamsiella multidivaricata]KAI7815832.1 hypothetical protein BC939DRAFT_471359 [Gamsiella multidivaricata]